MAWTISNAMMKAYENSLCSQELAAESSEATCSDGEQSAQSSTTPMPDQYYWPDKTTEHSRLSRFGMTCEPLTENHGEALLTWFRAGFPARISVQPAKAQDSTESEVDSGAKWPGLLAKYDLSSSMWKTAQSSLLEDLGGYSETFPSWGMVLHGGLWPLPTLVHPIRESAFGFLPTLTKRDYKSDSCSQEFRKLRDSMTMGKTLPWVNGGLLDANWCEEYMGWPIGWTELAPLATDKFQEWQQQHGGF